MNCNEKLKIQGQYYTDMVPDTYDLAERAALALKGVCNCIDKDRNHWMWFFVGYAAKKPTLRHDHSDMDCAPKLLDALTMLRQMTGDTKHEEVYDEYLKSVFKYMEDGIYWNRYEPERPWGSIYDFNPPDYNGQLKEDVAHLCITAKMEQTLLTLYQADGNPYWVNLAHEVVEALDKVTVKKDDYAYHPLHGGNQYPCGLMRSGWPNLEEPGGYAEPMEGTILNDLGFFLRSPVMVYQATGDGKAKELADRWARFLMKPKFWGNASTPEPICIAGNEQGHWHVHFHSTMRAHRAILDYGIVMHDPVAVEFAKRAYEYSWSMGIPKLGWVTEMPDCVSWMEGCSIGDLIAYSIRLCNAGAGDYWDDVDSIVRNNLAQAQYMRPDIMKKISEASEMQEYPGTKEGNRAYDGNDVIEKTVGMFLSTLDPDGVQEPWIMFCCVINCMQGLYYAWEAAVRETGDTAHVNLLFNRASRGLDVYSYLPYEGKVVIKNKSKRSIYVRIPGWAQKDGVVLKIDNAQRNFSSAGRYIVADNLKGGETLEITFAVPEYTASYTTNVRTRFEKKYTIKFRGSSAVDISPRNESPVFYPFYTDERLMTATSVPMKAVTRFIPEREIKIW